jgi:hypothetical protein
MAILNLGTVIAVAKETAIGVPVTNWTDDLVVSLNDGSGLTPSSEVLNRNLMGGSFISCASLSGTQSASGNLDTEIGVQTVKGTEAGKLKAHLIWEACLGTYIEQGADCSVPNKIGIEADPILNPTGYDLYKLSKPDEPSITLAVREYLGGTNKVLETRGVVVTSLAINLASGQIATASASVDGIDYAMPSGQTPLNNLGCGANPFVVKLAKFIYKGVSVDAQDVTVTINNEITDRSYIQGNGISAKVVVAKSVEVSYNIDLVDLSAYDDLRNNTKGALYIELVNGTEEMKIYIPEMSYTAVDKSTDGGILTLGITGQATESALLPEAILIATKK